MGVRVSQPAGHGTEGAGVRRPGFLALPQAVVQREILLVRKALAKRTKDQLIDVLVELASKDRQILRRLTERIDVEASPQELAAATRHAIADATDFDERDISRNFDYDYEAYEEVKRNLTRLTDQGELRLAMELSLELMKQGSYQVEMSDEGLMTQDIEECLAVVTQTLKKCDLPPAEVIAWCEAMAKRDRVGFIFERELGAIRNHFETLRSP